MSVPEKSGIVGVEYEYRITDGTIFSIIETKIRERSRLKKQVTLMGNVLKLYDREGDVVRSLCSPRFFRANLCEQEASVVLSLKGGTVELWPQDCWENELWLPQHPIRITNKTKPLPFKDHGELYLYFDVGCDKEDWFYELREAAEFDPESQVCRTCVQKDKRLMSNDLEIRPK